MSVCIPLPPSRKTQSMFRKAHGFNSKGSLTLRSVAAFGPMGNGGHFRPKPMTAGPEAAGHETGSLDQDENASMEARLRPVIDKFTPNEPPTTQIVPNTIEDSQKPSDPTSVAELFNFSAFLPDQDEDSDSHSTFSRNHHEATNPEKYIGAFQLVNSGFVGIGESYRQTLDLREVARKEVDYVFVSPVVEHVEVLTQPMARATLVLLAHSRYSAKAIHRHHYKNDGTNDSNKRNGMILSNVPEIDQLVNQQLRPTRDARSMAILDTGKNNHQENHHTRVMNMDDPFPVVFAQVLDSTTVNDDEISISSWSSNYSTTSISEVCTLHRSSFGVHRPEIESSTNTGRTGTTGIRDTNNTTTTPPISVSTAHTSSSSTPNTRMSPASCSATPPTSQSKYKYMDDCLPLTGFQLGRPNPMIGKKVGKAFHKLGARVKGFFSDSKRSSR